MAHLEGLLERAGNLFVQRLGGVLRLHLAEQARIHGSKLVSHPSARRLNPLRNIGLALLAVLVVTLTTGPAASAQTLQVHAGALTEPPENLQLALPEVTLDPEFDNDIESYRLRVPHTTTGLTIVATSVGLEVAGVEGKSADGNDLPMKGWRFSRQIGEGAILSFDNLVVGNNTIRVEFELLGQAGLSSDIYTIVVDRAAEVSNAAVLTALSLSSGGIRPPFAADTAAYEADVPGGVTGLTVTATPWLGGRVTISGRGADGDTLMVDGTRVSGLTVGRNTITLDVTAEDGVAHAEYSVAVHRDAPTGSVALNDLRFSEGPPEPGFMASAMIGELPEGNVHPTPAFSSEVTSYALDVSDPLVTIRARAADGSSFAVAGATTDGAALEVVKRTSMDGVNGNGAFLSVTLGGLAVGGNTITLTVSGENDTVAPTTTTIVVTRTTGG